MTPTPSIRVATADDLDALAALDSHLRAEVLREKIAAGQVLVAALPSGVLGWLRWGLFWDEIPFMNMLVVLEHARGRGLGGALVAAWEQQAREAGFGAVMTSTQSDESAQGLYRRRGYRDCGVLLLPGDPAEVFFRKELA